MTQRFRRAEEVDASKVGDRVVLYQRHTKKALVLNPTGARVWESLSEPCMTSDLAERLVQDFSSLAPDQAAQDVTTYLTELVDEGVVIVAE